LLKKDLISYTDLLAKYKKQESINKEQLTLVETDYNRDKTLFESKTISAREFDNKKKENICQL
jgi:multidrug resistance efflux pump